MNPKSLPNPLASGTYRIDCAGAIDAAPKPIAHAPASILLEVRPGQIRILAAGSPIEIDRHPVSRQATPISLSDHLITPAFINSHTHLDLTHIGPQPRSGFGAFVDLIRTRRHVDPASIRESVLLGATLSRAGGVGAVGDIAGAVRGGASIEPYLALRDSGLAGVSFLEFFAMGDSLPRAIARADEVTDAALALSASSVRFGLQPHAPYSVAPTGYRHALARAARDRLPIATHLAESTEEHEFIGSARGPQRSLLEALGLWSDSLLAEFGQGKSPVAHLAPVLRHRSTPILLVHLNDLSDADVALLSDLNAHIPIHIAYCPRSSDFFGAPGTFGPHRYRELVAAGINVCLGTDSIVNLPEADASGAGARISPLDDARLLFRQDACDARLLLQMLTVRGAAALALGPESVALGPNASPLGLCAFPLEAGLISGPNPKPDAMSFWVSVLRSENRPALLTA